MINIEKLPTLPILNNTNMKRDDVLVLWFSK